MSLRRAFYYSFGRTGGQSLIQFAANIVLARLMSPAEIGIYAVGFALVMTLNALRDFGVSRYLLKEAELTESKVRTVFGVTILVSWGLAALILLGRHAVAGFYAEPRLVPVLALLALTFLLLPFGQPAIALLRRDQEHGTLALITLAASLAGACLSILLAALGAGPVAMAWGALLAGAVTAALALRARPDHVRLRPSLADWRAVTGFGAVASAGVITVQAGLQMPALLLGRLLGFAEVGFFVRANGIAQMANTLLVTASNWVTGAAVAARHRAGEGLGPLVLAASSGIALLAWPVLAFAAFRAEGLILLLYGQAWAPAAALLPPLAIGWAITLAASQALAVCEGTGAAGMLLRNELLCLAIAVLFLAAGATLSLEAAAWARVPTAVAVVLVRMGPIRALAGVGLGTLLAALGRSAAVAAGVALALLGLRLLEPAGAAASPVWLLAAAALAGAVFLLLLFLVRHPLRGELLHALRRLARGRGGRRRGP
jgi:O-antigen/teichoic acid export membrane protein